MLTVFVIRVAGFDPACPPGCVLANHCVHATVARRGTKAGANPPRTAGPAQVSARPHLCSFTPSDEPSKYFKSLLDFLSTRKLKLASGADICVQQLVKEEDLG